MITIIQLKQIARLAENLSDFETWLLFSYQKQPIKLTMLPHIFTIIALYSMCNSVSFKKDV